MVCARSCELCSGCLPPVVQPRLCPRTPRAPPPSSFPAARSFQLLGLGALGFSHGFERLHYLLEAAFDGGRLSLRFRKDFDNWLRWAVGRWGG